MRPDRLLIFAKRPIPGRVKTRLVPALSPEAAAGLYEVMVHDVVALAARERATVELWYQRGAGARAFFESAFPLVPTRSQAGGGLGRKLEDAFERCFRERAERVVVIGSDSPTLPETMVSAAFDDLAEVQAVLGPTHDGGYYLVGLHRAGWPRARRLFREVPWSTGSVFERTVESAALAGITLRVLPGWYDIDELADLRRARADVRPESRLAQWLAHRPELFRPT